MVRGEIPRRCASAMKHRHEFMIADKFAAMVEQAIEDLPERWRVALAGEITAVIDTEETISTAAGCVVCARYVPALKLITLYQRGFALAFGPGLRVKEIRQVLEHELGHAGGLTHEAME